MKLPGTLKALKEQCEVANLGTPVRITWDADGNMTSLDLRPDPVAPSTSKDAKKGGVFPRRSPLDLMGTRPPEGT